MSLTFERLESRLLLTATAVRNGSTLLISGDMDADRIVVSGDGGPGRIDVDLDGNFSVDASFQGIKQIVISDAGGDNLIFVEAGVAIAGDLEIETGAGADLVHVQNDVAIGDDLIVDTGDGADVVRIKRDVIVGDNAEILTGTGVDTVNVDGVGSSSLGPVVIGNRLEIDNGPDASEPGQSETVDVRDVVIGDDLSIMTSDLEQTIGIMDVLIGDDLSVQGGDGDVTIFIRGAIHIGDSASLLGGAGIEDIQVGQAGSGSIDIGNDLIVSTGKGDSGAIERVRIHAEVTIGDDLTILGSDSDHSIRIEDDVLVGDNLKITTRGGNDFVQIYGPVRIGDDACLKTGSGDDQVMLLDVGAGTVDVGNNLKIETADGEDTVAILNTGIGGDLVVKTGNDADSVGVGTAAMDGTTVLVGGRTTVELGSADDSIQIRDLDAFGPVKFDGGSGLEMLSIPGLGLDVLLPLSRTVKNFEFVSPGI